MPLVEILRSRQGNRSQNEYARQLGISKAALSMIYSGQSRPGMRVVARILRTFPDLAGEVCVFLASDGQNHEQSFGDMTKEEVPHV